VDACRQKKRKAKEKEKIQRKVVLYFPFKKVLRLCLALR
jgi:hypothetical protein